MTANQIAYQKNLETERSNKERERISLMELEELKRANRAGEVLKHESNLLNYQGSVYSADSAYASSKYRTDADVSTANYDRMTNLNLKTAERMQNLRMKQEEFNISRERISRVDVPTVKIRGVEAVSSVFRNLISGGQQLAGAIGLI